MSNNGSANQFQFVNIILLYPAILATCGLNIHNIVAGQQQVNRRTMEGETPLLLACMFQDSTELVQMLLDFGANVNLGNNENHTPLHEGMIVVMIFNSNVLFWLLVSKIKKI
jgi:ankyrin repeat protein